MRAHMAGQISQKKLTVTEFEHWQSGSEATFLLEGVSLHALR